MLKRKNVSGWAGHPIRGAENVCVLNKDIFEVDRTIYRKKEPGVALVLGSVFE